MNALKTLRVAAAFAASLLFLSPGFAQTPETEPNDACIDATPVAWDVLPLVMTGRLDPDMLEEPPGDVDFFIVTGAPEGMAVRASLRAIEDPWGGTWDPYLGLFDADCNFLAANDNVLGLNSRIDFTVPTGGTFVLAATGCCDGNFEGWHYQDGAYSLVVLEQPVPIVGITGRVVDAVSGEGLAGNEPPYAWVELIRCLLGNCIYSVNGQPTDADGRFRFETDWEGRPLDPANYVVRAWANEYSPAEVGPHTVYSGEEWDLGDIALEPPPFVFEHLVACADLPAAGGTCRYSVDLRNNTATPVRGLAWSLVNTWGGTSPLGFSLFPADKVRNARVSAGGTASLDFRFDVPAGVAEGTTMCAEAWFSDRETEFFGTLRAQSLFCVMKWGGELNLVDPAEAAARLGVSHVQSWTPADRHPRP